MSDSVPSSLIDKHYYILLLLGGASSKEPTSAGDVRGVDLIPELGRSPGGGHSNPLQYFCLENPLDRGTWQAMVQRAATSQTVLW